MKETLPESRSNPNNQRPTPTTGLFLSAKNPFVHLRYMGCYSLLGGKKTRSLGGDASGGAVGHHAGQEFNTGVAYPQFTCLFVDLFVYIIHQVLSHGNSVQNLRRNSQVTY